VTVWLYFLIIPVFGEYKETLTLFSLLQFTGFVVLIFGVFLYNEIIIIKRWGLADNTYKMAILRQEEEKKNLEEEIQEEITSEDKKTFSE
jgi:hypothetical protein